MESEGDEISSSGIFTMSTLPTGIHPVCNDGLQKASFFYMRGFINDRVLYLMAGIGIGVIGVGQFGFQQKNEWTGSQNYVKFRTYKDGRNSQIEKFRTTIMNSQGDLQKYWAANTGEDPSQAPRDIDWNSERLIAINLGTRTTTGYSVFVKSIDRKDGNLVVTYVERKPPAGGIVGQALTSPWTIVRMQRVAGNISFEKRVDNGLGGIIVIDTGPSCGCNCGCNCCKNGHGVQ